VAPSIGEKLTLTSLTSGGRSVGIVGLWTEAMEFFFCFVYLHMNFETLLLGTAGNKCRIYRVEAFILPQLLHCVSADMGRVMVQCSSRI
jgi:hypothetical protein